MTLIMYSAAFRNLLAAPIICLQCIVSVVLVLSLSHSHIVIFQSGFITRGRPHTVLTLSSLDLIKMLLPSPESLQVLLMHSEQSS